MILYICTSLQTKMIRGLYNILCSLIAFIVLSSCVSPLEEQLHDVSPLCVTHPDSAMSILQTIQPDIPHANNIEKAWYDINIEAAYYIKHRVPTVTADSTLAYINESYGKELFLMKRILCAIHMFKSHKIEESFACLESCSRDLDADVHPYWKCVVDDYLAIIYLNSRVMDKSKEHFYRVLHRAEEMGDVKVIANAYSHLSVYYSEVNKLDSAFLYATKVLYNENVLDSLMLAVAYHNLASIQVDLARFDNSEIRNFLKQSKEFRRHYKNSPVTDALLAQSYYLCNGIDSAYIYHRKVVESNNDVAHLVLYKFLADYYNKQALVDSAYKYLKLYETRNAEFSAKRKTQSILNIYHQQKHEYSEQQSSRIRIYIIIGALIVIILLVTIVLYIRYRKLLAQKEAADLRIAHNKAMDTLRSAEEQLNILTSQKEEVEKLLLEETIKSSQYNDELSSINQEILAKSAEIDQLNNIIAQLEKTIEPDKHSDANELLMQSEAVYLLRKSLIAKGHTIKDEHWQKLFETINHLFPNFESVINRDGKLSKTDIQVCMLVKAKFSPSEIDCIMNMKHSYATNARKRLHNTIFGYPGSGDDFDKKIHFIQ